LQTNRRNLVYFYVILQAKVITSSDSVVITGLVDIAKYIIEVYFGNVISCSSVSIGETGQVLTSLTL